MIRHATINDKELLLRMWQEGYANTPFADMQYDPEHVDKWFTLACSNPELFFCRVVERKGLVVGILIGVVDYNFWGVPLGQALVSYSRTETDTLLRQFVTWCKEKGVKMVTVTTVPGKERYLQIVESLGFKESGRLYTKEI
jgi:hypothetical protein